MKSEYKATFFKYLDGRLSIEELESWIYRAQGLEDHLEKEVYSELIAFNFKNKYSDGLLVDLITEKIIRRRAFLTWKIKKTVKAIH